MFAENELSREMSELIDRIEAEGIAVVDLRKPFNASGNPRSLYYLDDGHWNKDGILTAARYIAQQYRKME